jgi:hypothetical protein
MFRSYIFAADLDAIADVHLDLVVLIRFAASAVSLKYFDSILFLFKNLLHCASACGWE